jgi:hypothetical protein
LTFIEPADLAGPFPVNFLSKRKVTRFWSHRREAFRLLAPIIEPSDKGSKRPCRPWAEMWNRCSAERTQPVQPSRARSLNHSPRSIYNRME